MLWDELVATDDLVLICDADNSLVNASKEKHRLIQFLLGLNETFSYIRYNLLMYQPLSTLSVAYSILLQE